MAEKKVVKKKKKPPTAAQKAAAKIVRKARDKRKKSEALATQKTTTKKTTKTTTKTQKKKTTVKTTIDEIDFELLQDLEDTIAAGARTGREMAKGIGVSYHTFRGWRHRKETEAQQSRRETIGAAIKKGLKRQRKALADASEQGLLKLVNGFVVEDETIEQVIMADGTKKPVKMKKVRKHFAPNVTAIIFSLCNTNPDQWKSINRMDENQDNPGEIVNWLRAQTAAGKEGGQ